MSFAAIIGIIDAIIAAGTRALPLIDPLATLINNAFKDEALTQEEHDKLHEAVRAAIQQLEEREPLTERYKDPTPKEE